MKKFLFPFAVMAAFTLSAFTVSNPLPIGADMPLAERKMKDVSGKEISLKDAKKDKGLLVMFSCNTCPYVIKNQSRTKEITDYAQQKGLGVILINSNEGQRGDDDAYTAMQAYAKEQGYKSHYVVDKDSKLADAFGATRTPENYLFNKEGKLVYHGAIDDNPGNESAVSRQHLKTAIDEMVTGKAIAVTISRSVGCAIKRKS